MFMVELIWMISPAREFVQTSRTKHSGIRGMRDKYTASCALVQRGLTHILISE
jgi:hypothetical protein